MVIEGDEGVDNYILLGLNRKEVKIMKVKEEKGIIMVELVSKKKKDVQNVSNSQVVCMM